MKEKIVQLHDLSYNYTTGHSALENVNLTIFQGERIAIMGPSGSGKTTLLKIIAGLRDFKPTHGVCINDSRFSMVFQQSLLLNYMTVKKNIALPSILSRKQQNINDIAMSLDIFNLLERYPFQLSGGQQRRVAFARALASPDISGLILDEPFSGLDEPLRERILIELHDCLELKNLSCVFSTHSPTEAAFLADRIVFLSSSPNEKTTEYSVSLKNEKGCKLFSDPVFYDEVMSIRRILNERYNENNSRGNISATK